MPNVLARAAADEVTLDSALETIESRTVGNYYTPVADWLHKKLRRTFAEQFPDQGRYDETFDRTEVVLGVVSHDLAAVRAGDDQRDWLRGPNWYGRSTWRAANNRGTPVRDLALELDSQGTQWGPLQAGLFGSDVSRASAALAGYEESFAKLARSRF